MNFSESEIEKAKEWRRLSNLKLGLPGLATLGSYVYARSLPPGCVLVTEQVFLVTEPNLAPLEELIWLPTLDECLQWAREQQISFAQLTDFLHRRRFTEGREREGVYQFFLERAR